MARKKTPAQVETEVLIKSARRCALCFYLDGDLQEKAGQIAHLDQNPRNSDEDNLAFLCLPHHSLYDSKTKQHKNYTLPEVKVHRAKLYEAIQNGKHHKKAGLPQRESQTPIKPETLTFNHDRENKQLLDLLAQILSENTLRSGSNIPNNKVVITDKEKERLLALLAQVMGGRHFVESAYFADNIYKPNLPNRDGLRKIFNSNRYHGRKSSPWSKAHFDELRTRLGIDTSSPFRQVHPMSYDQFLRMEAFLFEKLGLDVKSTIYLIQMLMSARKEIETVRANPTTATTPSTPKSVTGIKNKIERAEDSLVSRIDIGRLFIVFANLGALFTTRDWGTVGAISVLGGNIASTIKPKKK